MDEKKEAALSKEIETENMKEVGTERSTKTRTENSEEKERVVKEREDVDTASMGSSATQPKGKPEVELLKSAMKKLLYLGHFV